MPTDGLTWTFEYLVMFAHMLCRYAENDQTKSAMNINKNDNSVQDKIPRVPSTIAGRLQKAGENAEELYFTSEERNFEVLKGLVLKRTELYIIASIKYLRLL